MNSVNTGLINETEVRKTIQQLKPNGQLFEVRILQGKKIISGYFRDADKLIKALDTVDLRKTNVYITLNSVNEDCFSREQSEKFVAGCVTTSDDDIEYYQYLFIDFDPERTTGVSSTDEEFRDAVELADKVYKYLQGMGFEEPVKAISGNGAHLLYGVALKKDDENEKLIKAFLNTISLLFNTEKIKIDVVNYNPGRICKLYGTLAQKGTNTQQRPHRMSHIIGDVKELKATSKQFLLKVVGELPQQPEPPSRLNNYAPTQFNLIDFMGRNGITYKTESGSDCTIYRLDECPFNSTHKDGDSKIFQYSNGAIAFKCHHNHCSQYKWQDVRAKFEPDAYDVDHADQRIEDGWKQHNRDKAQKIHYVKVVDETADEPMFQNAKMILQKKKDVEEYIESGITVIDKRMKGLQKGKVSVLSGLRGAAKSTLLSGIMLNSIQNGHTVVCYSGELSDRNFLNWMMMQAAGKAYTKPYERYEGYYLDETVKPAIADWMSDRLWLYNNNYGNNFDRIGSQLREEIKKAKADLCIVDNLMALDLSSFDVDKYEAQTKFVWELNDIAKSCNVHVIFVAHPRKAQGFLRLDDIAGSGNIANIVDNAFIVHRNNDDFKRLTKQMYNWPLSHDAYSGTNVVEICKDRENGIQDCFIPLWYEPETKRLRNSITESIVYDWKKPDDGFVDYGNPFGE